MRVLKIYPQIGGSRMVTIQENAGRQRNIVCFLDKGHVVSSMEADAGCISVTPKRLIPSEVIAALEV
jgi:hypothetical protein